MSLIQEALRRQQEEATGGEAPPIATPPVQPPAPPPAGGRRRAPAMGRAAAPEAPPSVALPEATADLPGEPPVADESPRKKKSSTGVFIALAVLLIAGGIAAILFGLKQWKAAGGGLKEQFANIPTTPVEPTPPPVDPAVTDTPPDNGGTPPALPTNEPPPVVADEPWPVLTLTGVMGKDKNGSAMINGQIVGAGEAIEGVVVISIAKRGATLEFNGKQRFLSVGQSTQEE